MFALFQLVSHLCVGVVPRGDGVGVRVLQIKDALSNSLQSGTG